jgi:hypothetical protein
MEKLLSRIFGELQMNKAKDTFLAFRQKMI